MAWHLRMSEEDTALKKLTWTSYTKRRFMCKILSAVALSHTWHATRQMSSYLLEILWFRQEVAPAEYAGDRTGHKNVCCENHSVLFIAR